MTTLVSVDRSPYLAWQVELLRFSHAQSGQPGTLEVLSDTTTVEPPYLAANRPFALARWASAQPDDDRLVIILDPDMIFVEPIAVTPRRHAVIAQDGGFATSPELVRALTRHSPGTRAVRPLIPPIILHATDLAVLAPLWLRYTVALNADAGVRAIAGWLAEMWAFSLATNDAGLRVRVHTTAAVPPQPHAARLPVVHYAVKTPCFDKRTYTPWSDLQPCMHPGHAVMRSTIQRLGRQDPAGTRAL